VRRVSARPVLCGLYGLLVGYTDGEVEVHDLPVADLLTKDGGEPRRQAAAVREDEAWPIGAPPHRALLVARGSSPSSRRAAISPFFMAW